MGSPNNKKKNNQNNSNDKKKEKKAPLFFFHGITPGLWVYINFIFALNRASHTQDLFIIEIPHVTFKLQFDFLTETQFATAIGEILEVFIVPCI